MSTLRLAEVAAPPPKGLSKEEFERLWMGHRKVFLKIIYNFIIISYGWLNENDVMDICQDILSQVFEGALKKRPNLMINGNSIHGCGLA